MPPEAKVSPAAFLASLGHDPETYRGKRLSLSACCELYKLDQDVVLTAIDHHLIGAYYEYREDTLWLDALDAAYFYYRSHERRPQL